MTEQALYADGERVVSFVYGSGIVRRTSLDGALVHVYFDATNSVEPVPASTLRSAVGSTSPDQPQPRTMPPTPLPLSRLAVNACRLAVECLRQGLPPPGSLVSWTSGFTKERASIEHAINRAVKGNGSVLLVRAPYGQGKSHLGRLGRELAAQLGLLTMHVELDGRGLSMRDGAGVVAALLSSMQLSFADDGASADHKVQGLATLLRRAATSVKGGRLPPEVEVFAPFLERPSRWAECEEAIEMLEQYLAGRWNAQEASARLTELLAEPMRLQSLMMAWGKVANRRAAQAEQILRIAQLGRLAGAKGAFVTVDELDHDIANNGDGRVTAMLEAFSAVAREGPMVLMLLARDTDADEPEIAISGSTELVLKDLADGDMDRLVHKTIDAFAAAFPSPLFQRGREELVRKLKARYRCEYQQSGWGPRFFVRATIEACDIARLSKASSLASVEV